MKKVVVADTLVDQELSIVSRIPPLHLEMRTHLMCNMQSCSAIRCLQAETFPLLK